jgi:hypothetical protein
MLFNSLCDKENMMTPHQLRKQIYGVDDLNDSTLAIWSYSLNYIFENGWTDITDSRFVKEGKERFGITSQSLFRHLRRMRKRGLLCGHKLILADDTFGKIYDYVPRVFVRYTFHGMHSQEWDTRIESQMFETRGHDYTPKENQFWNEKFAKLAQSEQEETQQAPQAALSTIPPTT